MGIIHTWDKHNIDFFFFFYVTAFDISIAHLKKTKKLSTEPSCTIDTFTTNNVQRVTIYELPQN